jgi:hypothetical protein
MKRYHRNSLRTNDVRFDRDSRCLITRIASLSNRLVGFPVNLGERCNSLSPLFLKNSSQKKSEEFSWSEEAMQFRIHALINTYLMERSA